MEYIYAAMLLHKAGQKVTDASVKKVLEAAGVKPDEGKVKALVVALEGVDIEKVIKEAAVVTAAPAPAPAEAKGEKKKEVSEEEKKKSEEKAAAGLSALFG